MRQTSQVNILDDERDLPGGPSLLKSQTSNLTFSLIDLLDEISTRSLIMERYRKNHLFAELVFSPVPAVNHVKTLLFTDVSTARLEEILQRNVSGFCLWNDVIS